MSTVRRLYSWEILEVLPLLHAFNKESGYDYPFEDHLFVSGWGQAILQRQAVIVVQTHGGKITGCLGGQIAPYPASTAMRAQEAFFYVHPDHRGGSASTRMVKEYIKWAWERGVTRCQLVALTSTDTESRVREFYQALGFSVMETGFEIRRTF